MAQLIQIADYETIAPEERRAHQRLQRLLPPDWILTSNIPRHTFAGLRGARELDAVLLAPAGIFVVDFKHFSGRVTPSTHGPWFRGDGESIKNPFRQNELACLLLKNFFDTRANLRIWIEGMIVLTHPQGIIRWQDSDVETALRQSVIDLADVESYVQQASRGRKRLEASSARQALAALKPVAVPKGLFTNWDVPAPRPTRDRRPSTGAESRPISDHNVRRLKRCLTIADLDALTKSGGKRNPQFATLAEFDAHLDQLWQQQKEKFARAYFAATERRSIGATLRFIVWLLRDEVEDFELILEVARDDERLSQYRQDIVDLLAGENDADRARRKIEVLFGLEGWDSSELKKRVRARRRSRPESAARRASKSGNGNRESANREVRSGTGVYEGTGTGERYIIRDGNLPIYVESSVRSKLQSVLVKNRRVYYAAKRVAGEFWAIDVKAT